jgi:hypothetical protein
MNDLFQGFDSSAPVPQPLSAVGSRREDDQPGLRQLALSPEFNALAGRFDRISAREDMREPWISPHRTVQLFRVLAETFPNGWERARVSEMIDATAAHRLIELVGSRSLGEKIADALRFSVSKLLEN